MVKFAAVILVLAVLSFVSKRMGLPNLHFAFLMAILGSVAAMVLWPLFRSLAGALVSTFQPRPTLANGGEIPEVNRDRIEQVLVKQPLKAAEIPPAPAEQDQPAEPDSDPSVSEEDVKAFQEDADNEQTESLPAEPDGDILQLFEELREQYAREAVYAFRAYPPHREPHGRSKVGGIPDLPEALQWPRAPGHANHVKADLPLHFLAQIDVADLPWRPDGFPDAGMLLFFGRFDDALQWGKPDVDPENDIRVLFDPDYSGVPTAPPKNLPPLGQGNFQFDLLYGLPGDEKTRAFPEWPLKFAKVETMPEAGALPTAAPQGYDTAHGHHLVEQLRDVFGALETKNAAECDFQLFQQRTAQERLDGKPIALRPHSETGFPFAPRGISLVCRILRNRHAEKLEETMFNQCFEDWQFQADAAEDEHVEQQMADAFIEDLNDFLQKAADKRYGTYLKSDLERAMYRLVTEAGANPSLANRLPDDIYTAASGRHPVFLKDANGVKAAEFPGARANHCYHQLFGHLSSLGLDLPLDGEEQVLFQLFSDRGAELAIGDTGELDFVMRDEDAAKGVFDKVTGAHVGQKAK